MKKYILITLLASLIISFLSCYKDEIIKDEKVIIQKDHPHKGSTSNLVGTIVDENGEQLYEFTSISGNHNYKAKASYYHHELNNVNQNSTTITIIKDHHTYDFTSKPINKEINYIHNTIFLNTPNYYYPTNQELDITISDSNKIEIYANAYKKNGVNFTGTMNPIIYIPNLANPIHSQALPGGHLAITKDGNDVWLDYYNAIYIDLLSINNTEVSIGKNQGYVSLETNHCTDCKIWKYSSESKIWKYYKDISDSNIAIFEIEESGFYTLAKPYVYNLIEGEATAEATPIQNNAIDIYEGQKFIERVYTTNTGKWFTHLAINKNYTAKIKLNCSVTEHFNFNTTSEDIIYPNFNLTSPSISHLNLNGEVRSCDNVAIKNHFLNLWQDDVLSTIYFDKSTIDIELVNCATEKIRLQSINEDWNSKGPIQEFDANITNLAFDKSYTCNSFAYGYFIIKMDNHEKILTVIDSKFENDQTIIEVYDEFNLNFKMDLIFDGNKTGNYADNEVNFFFENLKIGTSNYNLNCRTSEVGCGFQNFNISEYGEEKDTWIKGKAKAKLWVKEKQENTALYKYIEIEFLVPINFK